MSGRYGPYITDGETNANVPKGTDPQAVTFEQAVDLLRQRAEQGGSSKKKKKPKAEPKTTKANGSGKVSKAKPSASAGKSPAKKKKEPKST